MADRKDPLPREFLEENFVVIFLLLYRSPPDTSVVYRFIHLSIERTSVKKDRATFNQGQCIKVR